MRDQIPDADALPAGLPEEEYPQHAAPDRGSSKGHYTQ